MAGHSFDHQTLASGGRPNQQGFYQASIGEFAEEEYEEDDPNTPVDKVENLKDWMVRVRFIKPFNHIEGTLGVQKRVKMTRPLTESDLTSEIQLIPMRKKSSAAIL